MAYKTPEEYDVPLHLFREGSLTYGYKFFGSHTKNGGVIFRVWAPKAVSVAVVGEFNHWNADSNRMTKITDDGIWELFIPELKIIRGRFLHRGEANVLPPDGREMRYRRLAARKALIRK